MFCVCVVHCTPRRRNKEGERQPRRRRRKQRRRRRRRRKRRRRSRRKKRKERQRPAVVPWRAIYRTPNFFLSFFIPSSRAPGGPLRLSFAFCLRRESCRVRTLHLPSCLSSFFCTDRPPNVSSLEIPIVFFSWVLAPSPASRACTRPFFCWIFSVPSFVATLRGAGAARCLRYLRRWRKRSYKSVPELRRAQSRAANEVAIQRFTIRRFCRGSHRVGETAEGEECIGRHDGIYTRYAPIDRESKIAEFDRWHRSFHDWSMYVYGFPIKKRWFKITVLNKKHLCVMEFLCHGKCSHKKIKDSKIFCDIL